MKVLVYGTGSIGWRHLQVISQITTLEPLALSVRAKRLIRIGRRTIKSLDSLEEAQYLGVKACVVATETGRHLRDALSALHYGFHVLLEKPMGIDHKEAQLIMETAGKLNRKVFVGCVLRFSKSLLMFRRWLDRVGHPHYVRIEGQSFLPNWRPGHFYKTSYSYRKREGGVMRDLIHEIDYGGWIFGWPSSLSARLQNTGQLGIQSEEATDILWKTNQGVTVSVHLDYLTQPTRRQMVVFGDKGSLEWNGVLNQVSFVSQNGKEQVRCPQTVNQRLTLQLKAFLKLINGGYASKHLHLATCLDGVKALAICDAARLSSKTKSEQKINY